MTQHYYSLLCRPNYDVIKIKTLTHHVDNAHRCTENKLAAFSQAPMCKNILTSLPLPLIRGGVADDQKVSVYRRDQRLDVHFREPLQQDETFSPLEGPIPSSRIISRFYK